MVSKSNRVLALMDGAKTLKRYQVHLGFAPEGHKVRSGDGRTPEGRYYIDRRNPRSDFYLSLGISYPNAFDLARAQAMGVRPGGDIFIHGGPRRSADRRKKDWTAGCIAVSDSEIEEIWSMVPTASRSRSWPEEALSARPAAASGQAKPGPGPHSHDARAPWRPRSDGPASPPAR